MNPTVDCAAVTAIITTTTTPATTKLTTEWFRCDCMAPPASRIGKAVPYGSGPLLLRNLHRQAVVFTALDPFGRTSTRAQHACQARPPASPLFRAPLAQHRERFVIDEDAIS